MLAESVPGHMSCNLQPMHQKFLLSVSAHLVMQCSLPMCHTWPDGGTQIEVPGSDQFALQDLLGSLHICLAHTLLPAITNASLIARLPPPGSGSGD